MVKQEPQVQVRSRGCTAASTIFLSARNAVEEHFVDEMHRIITSRKKVSITRDQGWYSESETRNDLKWSSQRINGAKSYCTAPERSAQFVRKNVYDGLVEYWITVRERGMHEEEHEVLEQQKSRSKAAAAVAIPDGSFTNVKELMDRDSKATAATDEGGDDLKADQNKQHFKRFMDSVLQKTTKLKGLLKDIRANYTKESTATYVRTLEEFITKLDGEYDSLNEVNAKGENEKYSQKWWDLAHEKMKQSTYVSSRASAAEQKVRKSKQFFEPVEPQQSLPDANCRKPRSKRTRAAGQDQPAPSAPGKKPKNKK